MNIQIRSLGKALMLPILLGGFGLGCSGTNEFQPDEFAEFEDEASFETISQALDSSNKCRDASPVDNTYEQRLPNQVTLDGRTQLAPGGYNAGKNGCVGARFFDINNFEAPSHFLSEKLTGAAAAVCPKRRIMVYAWEKTSNGKVYKGAKNVWGQVTVGFDGIAICDFGVSLADDLDLGENGSKDYFFAVSHRLYSVAGDTGSSWSTLPIYGRGAVHQIQ